MDGGRARSAASEAARRCAQVLDPAAQQAIWSFREAALGLVDGDEDRRQGDLVRRRHRGGAGEAARLHRALHRHRAAPPHHRRRLRARIGRLPARRPVVNLKTADGVAQVRGDRQRGRRPRARVRRRAVRRARRRPGPRRLQREDVRLGALPGVSRRSRSTFDPNGLFNPGRIVDTPPITSHLRFGAGYATPVAGDVLRLLRSRRLRPRGRDVQRRRAVPQEARRHDVPVVHGDARRSAFDARPRQHAAAGDGRTARRREALATRACTKCSISASNAAPARANARLASTWRDSRASSCPATGSATACRSPRRRSAARAAAAAWGSRFAPLSNAIAEQRDRALGGGEDSSASIGGDRCRNGRGRRCGSGSGIRDQGAGIAGTAGALLFADTFTNHADPEIGAGRDRRDERGRHRHARRAERLLRPAADFAGPPVGSAPARRGQRSRPLRRRRTRPRASCSSSRAACRRFAKTRRICCAASCSGARAWSRSHVGAVRGVPRGRVRAGPRRRWRLKPGPAEVLLHPHCHQRSMGLAAPAKALLSRIPSATVDRSRCRLLRHGRIVRLHARSLRRVARDRRAQAAAGGARDGARIGAGRRRHVVPPPGRGFRRRHGGASRRAVAVAAPPNAQVRASGTRKRTPMNLAWISLAALIVAITLSMVTSVNVGVVSLALAWIVGVYLGGMPVAKVIGTFPIDLLHQPGRHHAAVRHGQQQRHARPHRGAGGARLPRQRRRHPDHVLLHRRDAVEHRARQHRDHGDHGADGDGGRPCARRFRRS